MKFSFCQILSICAFYFFCCNYVFCQQDTTSANLVKLTLKDGSELIGSKIDEDSVSINFLTVGKISLIVPKNQITTIEPLKGYISNGEFITDDPNSSRLFFAPTARPIKAGQGYFSIYEIFFPTISVGIADIISLSGGISLIPGASEQLIYFAPKVTPFQKGDFCVAAGMLYISASSSYAEGAGIVYGITTYGNSSASITAGAGWGFSGENFSNTPVFLVGGEIRLSNSIKFITENWIPVESNGAMISFGLRFFGKKVAGDLGFIRPTGSIDKGFPFIPWIGFAYNF
jgi:hypothetical protein